MAEGKYAARDIKGRTPAIDATQSSELFALEGRNYVFDSLGVKSPFGDRMLSPVGFRVPDHAQGFRLRLRGGDRCFHFVAYGILEWDEATGGWQTIYATPNTILSPYRWTYEYLAGHLYLAHPRVGLLVYNLDLGRCDPHSEVGTASPIGVLAISQNNGRLGVLTTSTLAWSAPSDGLNFTPGFGGAGFQVLAERIPGDPIMLSSYARGFLTWTSGGVMRSEFSGDQSVFRHRTLNTEYRPINSFCTVRIDEDTVIILDERGLFQSRGESLTPYSQLFNEFLIGFLQENDFRNGHNIRIEWDDLQRRLYLSYSSSYADPLYEKCFVYYPPLEKWGEFNESHYGIFPLKINDSERADDYFGFVDSEGCVRYWLGTGSRERTVEDSTGLKDKHLYVPVIQKPVQYDVDETGQIVSASCKLRGFADPGITKPEGYYADGVLTPVAPELTGLDSLFRFGYIRLTGETAADEMSEITSLLIRSVKSGESDVLTEDFNLIPDGTDDEDFQLLVGSEDLGLGPINYINHTVEIVGTIDGDTDFDRVQPMLTRFDRAMRMFACSVRGIWHIVEIGAESVGEAYHIRTFEVTGTSAGRFL